MNSDSRYSFSVDVWSMGVVAYFLMVKKPPFETSDVKATYKRISEVIYYFPDRLNLSCKFKEFVGKILKKEDKERPSLDELLNGSFLNCYNRINDYVFDPVITDFCVSKNNVSYKLSNGTFGSFWKSGKVFTTLNHECVDLFVGHINDNVMRFYDGEKKEDKHVMKFLKSLQ